MIKSIFVHISIATLCDWFGVSRQAYYKQGWKIRTADEKQDLILHKVNQIRVKHPRLGTRKLYNKLKPLFKEQSIKMGRDALFNLLYCNHLLIRKRKRKVSTTNSLHKYRKYPSLIKEMEATAINQIWVSDITYWKTGQTFLYVSFITDTYSRKIIGYNVAQTLETQATLEALKMALSTLKTSSHKLIHHSDRGIQYCSNSYTGLLHQKGIKISMTENGDPLENAIAERVNGIIKQEYLAYYDVKNIQQARGILKSSVELYNKDRPHMSISNLTPNYVHNSNQDLELGRTWKNYYHASNLDVNPKQDLGPDVNLL